MAVFLELTVDPFNTIFDRVVGDGGKTKGAGLEIVRRPLRGIEIKEDTYAYIKMVRVDGQEIDLLDSSSASGTSKTNANFILQSVTDQRMERHQLLETFGDTYLFLFGEAPRMLQCQAVLINSHDFNWKAEFMANYDRYLRGTKSIEYGCRTYLFYDDNIIEGYILNAATNQTADQPYLIQLSFQFFVTQAQTVALLGDPYFPVRESVPMPEGVTLVETWYGDTLELVLDQTVEGGRYWTDRIHNWNRTRPVREKTYATAGDGGQLVSDEYTTPYVGVWDVFFAQSDREEELRKQEELDKAIDAVMKGYGKEPGSVFKDGNKGDEPSFWEELGLAPKVNADGSISFGNAVPGDSNLGGFVGTSTIGLDELGEAAKWVDTKVFGSKGQKAVDDASNYVEDKVNSAADWAEKQYNTAYGWSKDTADDFTSWVSKQTAKVGGYFGANEEDMNWLWDQVKKNVQVTTSNSSGTSTAVGGAPTPFAFVSSNGSLKNENLPPEEAAKQGGYSWSWNAKWSWPKPEPYTPEGI